MCLYTPQGLQDSKKKPKGSAGSKTSSRANSANNRGRATLPRGLIINQPMPIPAPQVVYPNQPRIEVVGENEITNIYLPTPPPQSQNSNQGGAQQGGKNGQNNERRRSSILVQEVDRAVAIAKRLGEAVRRGSASSSGRGRDWELRRELERERETERLRDLERLEREKDRLERLERGRGRSRARSIERRRYKERRYDRQERTPSSSRSRSRERSSKSQNIIDVRTVKEPRELKVVDEEARHLAQYAASTAGNLQREKDIKQAAKRIAEEKEKKEERLADRVLSRYGAGGLLTPPSPPPRGRFKDWDADRDRDRGRDWRDGVSWAPWNAHSYKQNYTLSPPSPPVLPAARATYNSGGNGNNSYSQENGNGGNNSNRGGNRGSSRSRSRERRHVGSNHIHVHTAPLVQGPQISTTTPGSAGAYGEMPGMTASSQSAGGQRSSFADPARNSANLVGRGLNGGGYRGMGSAYGAAMPQLHSHTMGGSVPIYGMNGMNGMHDMHGMGDMGMGAAHGGVGTMPVPVGEREWQRARVYNTTQDPGMGGTLY